MKINIRHEIDDDFLKTALSKYLYIMRFASKFVNEASFIEWLTEEVTDKGSEASSFFGNNYNYFNFKQEAEQLFNDWGLNEK